MGIFRRLGLDLTSKVSKPQTIVVWGASGSVGSFAVQLAKIVGLRVIAVAGAGIPAAKAVGADVTIDYRQGNAVEKIKEALKGEKLQFAFDGVSEGGTIEQLTELFDPETKGPKIVLVLYPSGPLPDYIEYPQTSVFSLYGEEQKFGTKVLPASPEDKAFAERFFPQLEQWLKEGKITPNKVTIVPNGLAGVSEGFQRMRDKKVSGEKLVFRISDTPGLSVAA
jgi:NADPH:quinone reductase-like Zn-dependent oxidoreductase